MTRPLRSVDGVFRQLHERLVAIDIPFGALEPQALPEALLERARAAWQQRVESEFRSVQILNRFLSDVLAAGDPLEVYAGANALVAQEIRHVAMCAGMLRALGSTPRLPEPAEVEQRPGFLALPAAERALSVAISMLAVNETLSVGFIRDLQQRCRAPVFRDVLDAILADESEHDEFGWEYVAASLRRFPADSREVWREVARQALEPQQARARAVIAGLPSERRELSAWPEDALADCGLFSPERQALVCDKTLREELEPRLRELSLWSQSP